MPLYPLGISRRRDIPSLPKQAAGAVDMRWSLSGDLACAFIDAPHHAVPPMLHATVLDAIHRRICVLPVRYGVALKNEEEIQSLLQNRGNEWLSRLSRLEWTCEMELRITPSSRRATAARTPSKPKSPLTSIAKRRSHYYRIDEGEVPESSIVQQFVERLHGYYRQWRKLTSLPSQPIRLAFLVERSRVASFRTRVENACNKDRESRCDILGPWPPYNFV